MQVECDFGKAEVATEGSLCASVTQLLEVEATTAQRCTFVAQASVKRDEFSQERLLIAGKKAELMLCSVVLYKIVLLKLDVCCVLCRQERSNRCWLYNSNTGNSCDMTWRERGCLLNSYASARS